MAAIQAVRQLLPSQSLINVAPAHIAARGTGKADGPVAADVLPREKLNWSERLSKEAWQFGDPQKQATEAFNRVIDAAAICENCANREQTFVCLAVLAEALPTSKQTLLERLTNRNTWQVARPRMDQWSTFGGSSSGVTGLVKFAGFQWLANVESNARAIQFE